MYRTITLLLLAHSLTAFAASPGEAGYVVCVSCHGTRGEGNPALNAPALAGQDASYLARQLTHFKSGARGANAADVFGAQMRAMAATLDSEQAVTAVAEFLSALPAPRSSAQPVADLRNGENQYNGACGACHGPRAQGNAALNAPRLAGLDGAYLRRQYKNFGAGIRGTHPDDRYGRQMAMMANMLSSEQDLNDVIAFILASSRSE